MFLLGKTLGLLQGCPGLIPKNQGELPTLVGVMTPDAHTSLVCGQFTLQMD